MGCVHAARLDTGWVRHDEERWGLSWRICIGGGRVFVQGTCGGGADTAGVALWLAEGKDTDTAGDESIGRHRRRTPSLSAHRGPISIHQPELRPPSFLHIFSPPHFPEPTASSVVARVLVFSLALERGGCIVLVVVARSTTNAGAGASMDLACAGAHRPR
ncbi:hypothetical protein C8R44DRAFT_895769 [Mycena epipterygia]|nr:hypothetical protein C8R44DRAFT_895769 [Mycena epipterygia]